MKNIKLMISVALISGSIYSLRAMDSKHVSVNEINGKVWSGGEKIDTNPQEAFDLFSVAYEQAKSRSSHWVWGKKDGKFCMVCQCKDACSPDDIASWRNLLGQLDILKSKTSGTLQEKAILLYALTCRGLGKEAARTVRCAENLEVALEAEHLETVLALPTNSEAWAARFQPDVVTSNKVNEMERIANFRRCILPKLPEDKDAASLK